MYIFIAQSVYQLGAGRPSNIVKVYLFAIDGVKITGVKRDYEGNTGDGKKAEQAC
jgi:hypothetical protein